MNHQMQKAILKSDVFKHKSDEDIKTYIEGNMDVYDDI